jgi:hypothetical protein
MDEEGQHIPLHARNGTEGHNSSSCTRTSFSSSSCGLLAGLEVFRSSSIRGVMESGGKI